MRRFAVILAALTAFFSCTAKIPVSAGEEPSLPAGARFSLFGGRERILCRWQGLPEAAVSLRFTFPDGTAEIPVPGPDGEAFLSGRPEGENECSISLLTADGAIKGPALSAHVYGARYESTLQARELDGYTLAAGHFHGTLSRSIPAAMDGEEFRYDDADGKEQRVYFPASETEVSIAGIDGALLRRSVYIPSPETGDTFYSSETEILPGERIEPLPEQILPVVDGYRGIWFALGQVNTDYGDKYSGGLGTYTMKHIPMAVYSPEAEKTFFVYGGTPSEGQKYLQCMIGCYDHATGRLQRPRMVMDKGALGVKDPHDNPTVQLDRDGHVWVFVSGRGNRREGYRYRSVNPYDITAFEEVGHDIMAYPQVMYHPEKGFFLFFTRYDGTRQLFWKTSPDGVNWTAHRQLASIKEGTEKNSGHYQISNICGTKLCTAFNRHINGNVDTRTNIYFVQSEDWGETWTTVDGKPVTVPVTQRFNNALVRDYQTAGKNCYIKDLNFDADGNPVILYLTSDNHLTGPEGGTREWFTLHWNGAEWEQTKLTESTHCYDSGSLWIEGEEWTVLAPTDAGPQYWGAGGEVVRFRSKDRGKTWVRTQTLTHASTNNNTYVRRPFGAADGFYAFWADGNPDQFTPSNLYFCNREGTVFRMPYTMTTEWQNPIQIND